MLLLATGILAGLTSIPLTYFAVRAIAKRGPAAAYESGITQPSPAPNRTG
jgi:hypothetical protein